MIRLARQVLAFTKNTLLHALRNKTIYAVLIAAGIGMGAASAMGALSLHQEERVFNDLVFAASMLFLVAIAIYQGVTSIHQEIETKTIFTVLSKPVTRASFLGGKYIASVAIITVCALLMFGLKATVAAFLGYKLTSIHLAAYFGGLLQLTIVLAMAFFFSTFSGPLLSALFTFSLFLFGSLTPQLSSAASEFSRQGNPTHYLLEAALAVLPDLNSLNLSYELTHRIAVPASYLLHATLYTASTIVILLLLSILIFHRRDFA